MVGMSDLTITPYNITHSSMALFKGHGLKVARGKIRKRKSRRHTMRCVMMTS